MTLLIPILVGFLILVIVVGVVFVLPRTEQDPLMTRINEYASREEVASIEEIELSLPLIDRIFVPIMKRLSNFVVRFTPQSSLERTARMIELAGSPRNISAANLWVVRFVLMVVFGVLVFVVMIRFGAEPSLRFLYAVGSTIVTAQAMMTIWR